MNQGTDIEQAAAALQAGLLVAIPTETVYGLAAHALDPDAVLGIFKAKNRPTFNPLIIHVASVEQAARYVADFPALAQALAAACWPGPQTLLLPKKPVVPDLVTAGSDRVAIRVPDHPLTLALLERLDFPLAAPSANLFGYISPTDAQHVQAQLGDKIAYLLDGGPAKIGIESTIVGFDAAGRPVIYRQGGISQEAIEAITGPAGILTRADRPDQPHSPGMLKSHYAPRTPLITGDIEALIRLHSEKKLGILAFQHPYDGVPPAQQRCLSPSGKLDEAAKNLFAAPHQIDAHGRGLSLAEKVRDTGLGRAINDRIERARFAHKAE